MNEEAIGAYTQRTKNRYGKSARKFVKVTHRSIDFLFNDVSLLISSTKI